MFTSFRQPTHVCPFSDLRPVCAENNSFLSEDMLRQSQCHPDTSTVFFHCLCSSQAKHTEMDTSGTEHTARTQSYTKPASVSVGAALLFVWQNSGSCYFVMLRIPVATRTTLPEQHSATFGYFLPDFWLISGNLYTRCIQLYMSLHSKVKGRRRKKERQRYREIKLEEEITRKKGRGRGIIKKDKERVCEARMKKHIQTWWESGVSAALHACGWWR